MKMRQLRSKRRSILPRSVSALCPLGGLVAALLAGVDQASAQTATGWLGDGATPNWSLVGNWANGIPGGAVTDLRFGTAFIGNPGGTNSLISNNDLTGFIGYRITFENYVGSSGFTLNGNGFTLTASGANAPRIQNDSTLLQTISLNGPLTFDGGAAGFAEINAVSGNLSLESTPVALAGNTELRVSAAAGKTVNLLGPISGAGGLVKSGAGTLFLSGPSSFGGQVQIRAGTISVDSVGFNGSEGTLGAGPQALVLGSAGNVTGTLQITGFGGATDKAITIADGGIGAVSVGSGSTLSLLGGINGAGVFKKTGEGTISLGVGSTHSGGTVISQGTLIVSDSGALGTGTITLGDSETGSKDVSLFLQVPSGVSTTANLVVSAEGTGLAQLKWSQDWFGVPGQAYNTPNDLKITLNRQVNFQSTAGGKQIAAYITGPGAGAGNISLKVDGGVQVVVTAALDPTSTTVVHNDFAGNVWITGNTKLQTQNRSYQTNAPEFYNGVIPDTATVIVDPGSLWQIHHGVETVAFISGGGSVQSGTGTAGNGLILAGDLTTPTTSPTTLGIATFSGTMGTIQGGLIKEGTGIQELAGPLITFNTPTTLNNGALRLTSTTGWASVVTIGAANNPTLQFGSATALDSWTFNRQIHGGSATARIEKVGPGITILSPDPTSTFFGSPTAALTATEGTLYLNSPFLNIPAVTVGPAGRFGGLTTVGPVTVLAGGTVEGGQGGSGVLTVGSLTFNGAGTIVGSLKPGATPLVVTGALTTLGGAQSINASISGSLPGNGTYHLAQFASYSGDANAFKFASLVRSLTLALNGNFLDVVVDSSNAPIWTGAGGSEWSTNILTPKNWKVSSNNSPTDFLTSDPVRFDDSATGSKTVDVSQANVSPTSIVFDNTAVDYTLTGTKDITNGGLLKQGTGLLTIQSLFSFPGGSTFKAGVVSVANELNLGTGTRTFDGGTLRYTGDSATWTRATNVTTNGGTLEVSSAGTTLIHAGLFTGALGSVFTKAGPGTLQLGAATIDSDLNIAGGTLKLDSTTGAITLNGKITGAGGLELYGNNVTTIGGSALNDFGGEVNIYGYQVFLNKPAGSNAAISGNINIRNGNWPVHGLTIMSDEQIADSAVLSFFNANDAYDFRLNGHTETIAGISSVLGLDVRPIIENSGYQGGNDVGILNAGTLIVSGPDTYTYYGQLRDRNGGTTGVLNFAKAGTGTQELSGPIPGTYTGTTTVSGGTLRLIDTTAFASPTVTVTTPGILELSRSAADWTFSKEITGGGGVVITADAGTLTYSGAATYTGPTTVQSGILELSGTLAGSALSVEPSATLRGLGHVGGLLTVKTGGTLSPGTPLGGALSADGGIALQQGSLVVFDLNGGTPSPGGFNDLVTVTGNLTLDGLLTVNDQGGTSFFDFAHLGDRWRLFDYTGTLTDHGLDMDFMPTLQAGLAFKIDLSTQGQVNLAVVPEPGAACSLLGGLGMLLGLRRRRAPQTVAFRADLED